jgi:hypothetical protein
MITKMIVSLVLALTIGGSTMANQPNIEPQKVTETVLGSREMSMDYRYPVASVSKVFKDNILLNIAYLDGRVSEASDINWEEVTKPFSSQFTLQPNEAFAYHEGLLPEYKDKVVLTTNAHFSKQDGFKTDGYLYGDGVCQLASLINWAALDANLEVKAPSNHDFAAIPEVPKKYGVAIYYDPNSLSKSSRQNLYIVNNQDKPVTFRFDYDGSKLKVSVSKAA